MFILSTLPIGLRNLSTIGTIKTKDKNKNSVLSKKDRKRVRKIIRKADEARVLRRALVLWGLDRGFSKKLLCDLECFMCRVNANCNIFAYQPYL